MSNIDFKKLLIGSLISYLIILLAFITLGFLGDNVELRLEVAYKFPFLLTAYPFTILNHYPEMGFLIIFFFCAVFILQRKFQFLNKLIFIVIMLIAWNFFGLLSMTKQAIDF